MSVQLTLTRTRNPPRVQSRIAAVAACAGPSITVDWFPEPLLGGLLALGAFGHPQSPLEPGQRTIEPQRRQQQPQVVALVRQPPARVADALRHHRNAVLLG